MRAAEGPRAGDAADVATVMSWRHFLNRRVMDLSAFEDGSDWGDVPAQMAAGNRLVAKEGPAIGFFAAGTPLDTDERLFAAWRVMRAAWSEILDALPDGCRVTYVLEPFLAEHGREPACRYMRVAGLAVSLDLSIDTPVVDVIRAAHEAAQARAVLAASDC